jgi:hypothetical protein
LTGFSKTGPRSPGCVGAVQPSPRSEQLRHGYTWTKIFRARGHPLVECRLLGYGDADRICFRLYYFRYGTFRMKKKNPVERGVNVARKWLTVIVYVLIKDAAQYRTPRFGTSAQF